MPSPTEALLKRPSTTLIFFLTGSSTDSVLLSFSESPLPSALHCSSLIPQPMKSTAKRLGKGAGVLESAQAESEGSHGKAMVTPAPRNTVRREKRRAERGVKWDIEFTFPSWGSLFREDRACVY